MFRHVAHVNSDISKQQKQKLKLLQVRGLYHWCDFGELAWLSVKLLFISLLANQNF